jgi:hypothetical protein
VAAQRRILQPRILAAKVWFTSSNSVAVCRTQFLMDIAKPKEKASPLLFQAGISIVCHDFGGANTARTT